MPRLTNVLVLSVAALALVAGCSTPRRGDSPPVDGPTRAVIESDSAIVQTSFSPDSRHVAYLDQSGTVHLWDVLRDRSVGEVPLGGIEPRHVVMGTDLSFAVAGRDGIEVRKIGADVIARLPGMPGRIEFMLFDANGEHLAVAEDSGSVRVVEVASGAVMRQLSPPTAEPGWNVVPGAGFGVLYTNPDGRMRSIPCDPELAGRRSDAETAPGTRAVVSDDGTSLALIDQLGAIEVWSMAGAGRRATFSPAGGVIDLDLSPDGSVVAVATANGTVELWDIDHKERLDSYPSQAGDDGQLSFSPDAGFLSWIEAGRTAVRFWVPARGAMQWTADGPVLREDARDVCSTYASILRFRIASQPFAAGVARLERREIDEALAAFVEAARTFPDFPGLRAALKEAHARHEAARIPERLGELEASGQYVEALAVLDAFLDAYGEFDEFGFGKRAATLREVLGHLERAAEHRKAGRDVDAVLEFDAAVALEPDLVRQQKSYSELRQHLQKELAKEAETAHADGRAERVIELYTDLARLQPLSGAALLRLGEAHERLGRAADAEAAWTAIDASLPEYVSARRSVARLARAAGDHRKALEQLEMARRTAPGLSDLEREYAEACQLCGELELAVSAWSGVAQLEPDDPRPLELVAELEEERENWQLAAIALRQAIGRSDGPRPRLLLEVAKLFQKAGQTDQVLTAYLDLLAIEARDPGALSSIGPMPRRIVENWIRNLGYVHHRDEWVPRDQFLLEQGWVRFGTTWMRPDEAKLHEVASRYEAGSDDELRVLSEERYAAYVQQRRIGKGMNRREVIAAWGFFEDLNVLEVDSSGATYEQLLFDNSRRVYLRNGLVCFWTE